MRRYAFGGAAQRGVPAVLKPERTLPEEKVQLVAVIVFVLVFCVPRLAFALLMVIVSELAVVDNEVCVALAVDAAFETVVTSDPRVLMLVEVEAICVLRLANVLVATLVEACSEVMAVARLATWRATVLIAVLIEASVGTRVLRVPETLEIVDLALVISTRRVFTAAAWPVCTSVARDTAAVVAVLVLVAIDSVVLWSALRPATVLLRAEMPAARLSMPAVAVASLALARETSLVRSVRSVPTVFDRTDVEDCMATSAALARALALLRLEMTASMRTPSAVLMETSAEIARDTSEAMFDLRMLRVELRGTAEAPRDVCAEVARDACKTSRDWIAPTADCDARVSAVIELEVLVMRALRVLRSGSRLAPFLIGSKLLASASASARFDTLPDTEVRTFSTGL